MERLKDTSVLVVLDEAYFEFATAPDYPDGVLFLDKYKNMVSLRTLSKVCGLAGLRLGILMGDSEIIDGVNRITGSYNVNSLAQVAAVAAVKDKVFLQKVCQNNQEGLKFFYESFKKLGLQFWPSQASFILFDCIHPSYQMAQEFLKKGFIVRLIPGLDHHIRVSVGLREENQKFIQVLKLILGWG